VSSKKPLSKKRGLSWWEKAGIPIIIIVLVWIAYSVMQGGGGPPVQTTTSVSTVSSGSFAPDFTLPVVGTNGPTGGSITLSSLRGKVVLLEFMEPWCPHCQADAPILNQLHQKYPDLTIVSVAGPWSGASENDLAQFEQNYGSNWVYLFDSSGSIMNMYGVTATPTFFVINKDGSVATSLQGQQDYGSLESAVVPYLQS
jgi:thiol-disulfide isomerase/thioredoxin